MSKSLFIVLCGPSYETFEMSSQNIHSYVCRNEVATDGSYAF